MSQKGFINIILVVAIVILVSAVGYFVFVKKSEPITQQSTPTPAVIPTKTLTPTSTPPATEKAMGYIRAVYENNGKKYLDIDYIQMLGGLPAVKAKIEDRECLQNATDTTQALLKELEKYNNIDIHGVDFDATKFAECVPLNNYYIRNQNSQIRTFEISKDVQISIAPGGAKKFISYEEFKNLFASKDLSFNHPFNIEVVNGLIMKITEQFLP